ncbi:hypothetical protein TWF694_001727 [Orbilia ellipsospora]|uniref:Stc1 domain-containing protein n=1 Tax=Orbilia ellipsospora TaxID=2528407 RepID=A0AAV9X695_9PEZI
MSRPYLPKVDRNLYNKGSSTGSNVAGGKVNYPSLITCCVCHRQKPHSQYSARQLGKFKNSIYQPYAPGGRVKSDPKSTCKACTPDQTTELTCIVCGETNGLDHFAKTQRKTPDKARCKNCIKQQADTAHDLEVPDSDEYVDSDDDDEADFDTGVKPSKAADVVRGGESTTYAASDSEAMAERSLTSGNLSRLEDATGPNDGWVTKGRKPAAMANTYDSMTYDSASKGRPENSTANQRQPEVRKNGWAKVEKIGKNVPKKNNVDYDSDDDDESVATSATGTSGWTDKTQKLKTDFDTDPWARYYR